MLADGSESPIAILIVSFHNAKKLRECLQSVRQFAAGCPVAVWDNHSDGSADIKSMAAEFPWALWSFSRDNVGFATAVNRLIEIVPRTPFVLLLNPDALLKCDPRCLLSGDGPNVAAVGAWSDDHAAARQWDNAKRPVTPLRAAVEDSGLAPHINVPGLRTRYRSPSRTVGYITGSCLLIKRKAWEDVGPFDERFFLYSEEVDWSRRAQKRGWQVVHLPLLLSIHTGAGTVSDDTALSGTSERLRARSRELYLRKHFGKSGVRRYRTARTLLLRLRRTAGDQRNAAT